MGFRRIVVRPDFMRIPDLPLPLHVRSTGHYLLELDYIRSSTGNEKFVEVFWGIAGAGEVLVDGVPHLLRPDDVLWKLSTESHGYRPLSSGWELRWFTFDGELADSFMKGYGYPRRLEKAGPCPRELFLEMEAGLKKMSRSGQRRLVAVAAELLALAGSGLEEEGEGSRLADRFIELVQSRYTDSGTNINVLAGLLGVHRTTLAKRFSEVMELTPGEYLARVRLTEALAFLRDSDLSIGEIAERTGLAGASHFSNAVKRFAGASPTEIRRLAKSKKKERLSPAALRGRKEINATFAGEDSGSPGKARKRSIA